MQINPKRKQEFIRRWRELLPPMSPDQNGEHERIWGQIALEFALADTISRLRHRFGGGFDRQLDSPIKPLLLILAGTAGSGAFRDAYDRLELLLEFADHDEPLP